MRAQSCRTFALYFLKSPLQSNIFYQKAIQQQGVRVRVCVSVCVSVPYTGMHEKMAYR